MAENTQLERNPIGWVEIPVQDMARAEAWYGAFFNMPLHRQPATEGYTMSSFEYNMSAYGAGAALMHGKGYTPGPGGAVVYFTAPSGTVEADVVRATEMGIAIIVPRMQILAQGWIAVLQDSEGNHIAIHAWKG